MYSNSFHHQHPSTSTTTSSSTRTTTSSSSTTTTTFVHFSLFLSSQQKHHLPPGWISTQPPDPRHLGRSDEAAFHHLGRLAFENTPSFFQQPEPQGAVLHPVPGYRFCLDDTKRYGIFTRPWMVDNGWFLWFSCRWIYNRPMDPMGMILVGFIDGESLFHYEMSSPT